jgi:hypothetical protein
VAAHVIARHPEQGWSLLCNGIVLFDDGGLLLPDGRAETPHARPLPRDRGTTAVGQRTRHCPRSSTLLAWPMPGMREAQSVDPANR